MQGDAMITFIKLKFLELKIAFGEFGQQTKYRRLVPGTQCYNLRKTPNRQGSSR
jgi:hypothetical protein